MEFVHCDYLCTKIARRIWQQTRTHSYDTDTWTDCSQNTIRKKRCPSARLVETDYLLDSRENIIFATKKLLYHELSFDIRIY